MSARSSRGMCRPLSTRTTGMGAGSSTNYGGRGVTLTALISPPLVTTSPRPDAIGTRL